MTSHLCIMFACIRLNDEGWAIESARISSTERLGKVIWLGFTVILCPTGFPAFLWLCNLGSDYAFSPMDVDTDSQHLGSQIAGLSSVTLLNLLCSCLRSTSTGIATGTCGLAQSSLPLSVCLSVCSCAMAKLIN